MRARNIAFDILTKNAEYCSSVAHVIGIEFNPRTTWISGVRPGSQASKAGLKIGDVLLSVNGDKARPRNPSTIAPKEEPMKKLVLWSSMLIACTCLFSANLPDGAIKYGNCSINREGENVLIICLGDLNEVNMAPILYVRCEKLSKRVGLHTGMSQIWEDGEEIPVEYRFNNGPILRNLFTWDSYYQVAQGKSSFAHDVIARNVKGGHKMSFKVGSQSASISFVEEDTAAAKDYTNRCKSLE